MKLSKREAFLLFFVSFVLVLAVFLLLLIFPLQNQIADNRSRLTQLEFQRMETENKVTLGNIYQSRKDTKLSEVNQAFDAIASPLHAAEFERWMIPLMQQYNVYVSSVDLSPTTVDQPNLLASLNPSPVYQLQELVDDYNGISKQPASSPSTNVRLLKASYTYSFITPFNNYLAILDEVKNWNTSFIVARSSYNIGDSEASLTIDVYSVDKLEEQMMDIYMGDYTTHYRDFLTPRPTTGSNQTPTLPDNK